MYFCFCHSLYHYPFLYLFHQLRYCPFPLQYVSKIFLLHFLGFPLMDFSFNWNMNIGDPFQNWISCHHLPICSLNPRWMSHTFSNWKGHFIILDMAIIDNKIGQWHEPTPRTTQVSSSYWLSKNPLTKKTIKYFPYVVLFSFAIIACEEVYARQSVNKMVIIHK